MKVTELYKAGDYQSVLDLIQQIEFRDRTMMQHYYFIKALNRLYELEEAVTYMKTVVSNQQNLDEVDHLKLLYELIWAFHKQGNWREANKYMIKLSQLVSKVREKELSSDEYKVVNATINLGGIVHLSLGNVDKAMHNFQMLLEDDHATAEVIRGAQINIAFIHIDKGEYQQAIQFLKEALESAKISEHSHHIRVAGNNLAHIYTIIGDLVRAETLARNTLEVAQQTNDRWGVAIILTNLGHILLKKGNHNDALRQLEQAYIQLQEFGNEEYISRVLFYQLLIHLDLQHRFNANEVLLELKSYSHSSQMNSRLDLMYQLAEAIYLSHSAMYTHKIKAIKQLKDLIQTDPDIEKEFISYAYLFLAELLLRQVSELQSTGQEEHHQLQMDEYQLMDDIEEISQIISEMATEQNIPELRVQSHYINAHLALVRLDTDTLTHHLKEAELIARQSGLEKIIISEPDWEGVDLEENESRGVLNLMESISNIIHSLPRLKILMALSKEIRLTFAQLQDLVELSSGNLSNHCKVLIEKGYLIRTKEFVENKFQTVYSMTPHGLKEFKSYSAKLRSALRLD